MKQKIPALLLACGMGIFSSLVHADVSPEQQKAGAEAYQALEDLARQTRAQRDLPRWSNPEHAQVLGRLWDAKATLGASPYRSADVSALLTIAERAGVVFKSYVLFTPDNSAVPNTAVNTAKYQDEIVRAGAYLLRAQAAGLEAITDFVATLPTDQMNEARRAGLRQLRLGIMEQVYGLTLMLRSPALRAENRRLMLDALSESAGQIAQAAPLVDRVALVAQIDAMLPDLTGADRDKAQAIKSAFSGRVCTGLCAVHTP